jgi:hypothetical protein
LAKDKQSRTEQLRTQLRDLEFPFTVYYTDENGDRLKYYQGIVHMDEPYPRRARAGVVRSHKGKKTHEDQASFDLGAKQAKEALVG